MENFKNILVWIGLIGGGVIAFFVYMTVTSHIKDDENRNQLLLTYKSQVEQLEEANKGWADKALEWDKSRREYNAIVDSMNQSVLGNNKTINDLRSKLASVPKKRPAPTPLGESEEMADYRATLNEILESQNNCMAKAMNGATDVTNC